MDVYASVVSEFFLITFHVLADVSFCKHLIKNDT